MNFRLCVLALVSTFAACSNPPAPPNVLLVTIDTTRADRLSCYGYEKETSPRLDRLAESGIRFENAISQAAVTPVSHASILTGLNPYSHGLRVLHGMYENRLAKEHMTLAEVLRADGWSTAAFVSAFPVSERFGMEQGYETFDAEFIVETPDKIVGAGGTVNTGMNQRRGDKTTDLALDWLETAPRPFHLWVHYFDVHDDKVLPPKAYMDRYGEMPTEIRDRLRKIYDIEIEYQDEQIGRVLDALEQKQELANTIVIVVADHGEGLGDHDWWTHGVLYQEQINVPLVLTGPGVPKNQVVSELVSTTDIAPTVYALCNIDPENRPPADGASLLDAARGKADPARVAYSDSVNLLTYGTAPGIRDVKNDMLFAVVQGRWKYIHHLSHPNSSELYDLVLDPDEKNNMYRERPKVVEKLRELAVGGGHVPEKQLDHNGMSAEDKARLEALGYVGDQ